MDALSAFLKRHDVLWKAFAAIFPIVGGVWAFVILIYPDFILPRFDSGKLDVTISAVFKGETADANVWGVILKRNNNGKRRLYIPDAYYYVRAYRFESLGGQHDESASEEVRRLFSDRKLPIGKDLVEDEQSNFAFYKKWEKVIRSGDFQSVTGVGSGYGPRDNLLRYIYFGRVSKSASVLEAGEISETEFLVAIPRNYQGMQVDYSVVASKEYLAESFVGVPRDSGIEFFPLAKGSDLKERLSRFGIAPGTNVYGLDPVRYFEQHEDSLFLVSVRKQFFVGGAYTKDIQRESGRIQDVSESKLGDSRY